MSANPPVSMGVLASTTTERPSSGNRAKKLRYLSDSVFSFSDLPIRVLTVAGILGITVSLLFGSLVFAGRLFGRERSGRDRIGR